MTLETPTSSLAERPLIAVWLLTGFLGSGKTTLLRQLAARATPGELALIINEFADVGIDQQVLNGAEDDVLLLEGGCVCCVVRNDLVDALHRLRSRVRQGLPALRRVVIETSGLADPNPIVHALQSDARLRDAFALAAVLTVVDATSALEQVTAYAEAAAQVAAADHLLISKTDLAVTEDVRAVETRLAELNPLAQRHRMDHGRILDLASGDSAWTLQRVDAALRPSAAHARHSTGVSAQVVEHRGPLEWTAFCDWLQGLCLARGRDLLRIKGIVHVTGEAEPRLVNAVNFAIYPAERLAPGRGAQDRVTRLVLIGRNLDGKRLQRTLEAALR